MAVSANAVFEVRATGGSDDAGGFFVTGASGSDYSQQTTNYWSGTVTAAGTTLTRASGTNWDSSIVGNGINIGASGSGVLYEITAFTDASTCTIDRSFTGTGVAARIGGCLASPGMVAQHVTTASAQTGGYQVWLKGAFTNVSTSTNVRTGRLNLTTGGSGPTGPNKWEGYSSTRNDGGLATITSAGVNTEMITIAANWLRFRYIKTIGHAATVNHWINSSGTANIEYCQCQTGNLGFNFSAQTSAVQCIATSFATGFIIASASGLCQAINCTAITCTTGFFANRATTTYTGCFAIGGTTGFTMKGTAGYVSHCTSYGATTAFSFAGSNTHGYIYRCAALKAGTAFSKSGTNGLVQLIESAALSCTTTYSGSLVREVTPLVVITSGTLADPVVNAAGGDYSLKPAASSAWHYNTTWPGTNTINSADFGAYQHREPQRSFVF